MLGILGYAFETEKAPLVGVEDPRENGWRVEARQAQEIDAAGNADQSRGVQVADDAVLGNGKVAVGVSEVVLSHRGFQPENRRVVYPASREGIHAAAEFSGGIFIWRGAQVPGNKKTEGDPIGPAPGMMTRWSHQYPNTSCTGWRRSALTAGKCGRLGASGSFPAAVSKDWGSRRAGLTGISQADRFIGRVPGKTSNYPAFITLDNYTTYTISVS